MDDKQRLHLHNMMTTNNVEDTTDLIRQLKHSHVLRDNVNRLLALKAKYPNNSEQVHLEAMMDCHFLFTYYTDIYNKIRKDEMNLSILFNAFDLLQDIEDEKIVQHEGAFAFGTLMKQIYVDSALKKADKLNAISDEQEPEYKGPQIDISWSQFKKQMDR